MEYINLQEYFNRNIQLEKGDYLYKHHKDEYPLTHEFDISNLFFVTKNNGHNLTIHNMANCNVLEVDFNSTSEKWWLLPIPITVKKQIGLKK